MYDAGFSMRERACAGGVPFDRSSSARKSAILVAPMLQGGRYGQDGEVARQAQATDNGTGQGPSPEISQADDQEKRDQEKRDQQTCQKK
jgi:hypothetical protein